MIGWLVSFGLSRRAAIGLLGLAAVGLALIIFTLTLHAYGDARYKAGKRDADAAWVEAGNRLVEKAHKSADKADVAAAARVEDFTAQQEAEKQRIENAQANGTSAFDVMFGNSAR